ncbi:MAG: hypothetical protein JRJ60_14315 [Deltaproteobacteria bacterium]|nr:hypothetical protein [Deltaproteobacteria bacterium]
MEKKLCIFVAIIMLCAWSSPGSENNAGSEQQRIKQRPPIKLILPDLVLEKIETKSEPYGSDKVRITISYWIFNNSTADSRCCPTEEGKKQWKEKPAMNLLYRTRVEARAYSGGIYSELGGTGTETKANERQKYTATHVVKKGSRWKYRVTADYGNWIREKNENNNQKIQNWPMRIRF